LKVEEETPEAVGGPGRLCEHGTFDGLGEVDKCKGGLVKICEVPPKDICLTG
jgi:hypothetical protein